ncbi:YVTN family beta-propeller repeat family protein, partial [mine drainage metagenome]
TNLSTLSTVATIPTPATKNPGFLSIDPSGKYAYLTGLNTYNISVISLSTFTVVSVLKVAYDPSYVAFSPNGTLAISISAGCPGGIISHQITEINSVLNKVITNISNSYLSNPGMAAFSTNGTCLVVTSPSNKNLVLFNATSMKYVQKITSYFHPESISFLLNSNMFYATGYKCSGVATG